MEITIEIKGHTNERETLFTAYLHVYGDDVISLPLQDWVIRNLRKVLGLTHDAETEGIAEQATPEPRL